ncbi:hypothetical protein SAMN06295943_0183 [Agreia sp. VKM Ac-1783]|nr:hypothetical protein SAMN06295943_0183 [Agreia sp. VKM Ac-1783]
MGKSVTRTVVALCALIALGAVAGVAASRLDVQITLSVLIVLSALCMYNVRRVLIFAVVLVPLISLVRRLVSGGRVDSDPLVLVPLILVMSVLLVRFFHEHEKQTRANWVNRLVIAFAVAVAFTLVLRTVTAIAPLYAAGAIVVPLILIPLVVDGRVPDVWLTADRVIPVLGILVGLYGVYQFFFLPEWDKSWMIASDLNSIGAPNPLEVRVFGASESPGPYALFVGLASVVALAKATITPKLVARVLWFACAASLTVPLILSGVRTALLAVAICAVVLALIRGKGFGRFLPIILVVLVALVLVRILNALDGSSSILSADRYTEFDSDTDGSFQARLGILQYFFSPLKYLVGNPSENRADSLVGDTIVQYGYIAGILITVLCLLILLISLRNMGARRAETASLSSIFIVVSSVSGNVFLSTFGIVIGLAFAATAKAYFASRQTRTPIPANEDHPDKRQPDRSGKYRKLSVN